MTGGPRFMSTVLLCRSLRHRYNGHVGAAFSFRCELNLSIDEREQRVIFAGADITTGVPFGAALARKDIAGEHDFAVDFKPSRRPAESRPFREDPPAFLCAIVVSRILLLCTLIP
jgi:hypothetical protein